MLAAEKTKSTFVAPVGIGLSLFVAELAGVFWTGGSLNPTRSFGPDVVSGQFNGYHWIYWLGPFLGALLASGFYVLIKYLNYEEVNGDQDKSQDEEKILDMVRQNDGGQKTLNERQGGRGSQSSNRPESHHQNGHDNTGGEYQRHNVPDQTHQDPPSASQDANHQMYMTRSQHN